MKISQNLNKIKQNIKRITFFIALIISYIIIVQFLSIFVDIITTIFMYLSSFGIFLGLFIINRLKKSFLKKMTDLKNFKNLDDNFNISAIVDRLIKNEISWIEFYESQIHQFIRIKAKTSFYIIVRIFLFISLSIIVVLLIISIKPVSLEINVIISNIISLLQIVFLLPLIVIDLYINSGKMTYRYSKKTSNYIKKRNKLIYHNTRLRIENKESFKVQVNNIEERIDDYNKILTPFSNYIKEFDIITAIGIFINIFLVVSFEYFWIPLLYLSIIYLSYIVEHVRTNRKVKRTELYQQIESDLDLLTFSE